MDGETRDRDALLAQLEDDARAAMDAAERGALAGAEDLAGRVLHVARSMEPSPRLDRCLSRALRACGTAQRARGRYGAAERSFEHALASATSGFGGITVEVAELLNDLGMTYKFDGRFELAEAAYARASTLLSALPEVDPQDAAALLHNLAGLAHARGDLITAEPLARRAIEVRSEAAGEDDVGVLLDRSAHAAILSGMGRVTEAEASLRGLLPELEHALGTDHPEVAIALNNLAAIVQSRGQLAEAERLYRRVVAIKRTALGPSSPRLAVSLNNLGTTLRQQGRREEAAALYRQAIELLAGEVTDDHPNLTAIRTNLARIAP